jgi:hypothetical protein
MDQLVESFNTAFNVTGVQEHRGGVRLPGLLQRIGLQPQSAHEAVALAYRGSDAVAQANLPVVRSILGVLTKHGVASEEEIGIDTLAELLRR